MADIGNIQSYLNFLSGSPIDIFLNFVLPIPVLAYAIYLLLGEIRIFSSTTVRGLLGITIAVTAVLAFSFGSLALWAGFAGIIILKIKNWSGRVIGLMIFLLIVTQISNLSLSNLNIQVILLLVFSAIALIALVTTEGFKKQIVVVIIIFVACYLVLVFLLPQLRI
jgi:hypothetical protein